VILLDVAPAVKPEEVFAMDALYSAVLITRHCELRSPAAGAASQGPVAGPTHNSNGSVTYPISSMSQLAGIFRQPKG
jgi:hypothetical protein